MVRRLPRWFALGPGSGRLRPQRVHPHIRANLRSRGPGALRQLHSYDKHWLSDVSGRAGANRELRPASLYPRRGNKERFEVLPSERPEEHETDQDSHDEDQARARGTGLRSPRVLQFRHGTLGIPKVCASRVVASSTRHIFGERGEPSKYHEAYFLISITRAYRALNFIRRHN
jgi:hypothetical protein